MSREWKPGDLALITQPGTGDEIVAVRRTVPGRDARADLGCWHQLDDDRCYNEEAVESARPLVVIDPEDDEQVDRLRAALRKQGDFSSTLNLYAALRSLVAPPKPDEPTGLGAVVEDADGVRWTRTCGCASAGDDPADWRPANHRLARSWPEIAAVRVLSEGVQP